MKTKIFFRSINPKKRNPPRVEKHGYSMFKSLARISKIRHQPALYDLQAVQNFLNFHSIFRKSAELFFGSWKKCHKPIKTAG